MNDVKYISGRNPSRKKAKQAIKLYSGLPKRLFDICMGTVLLLTALPVMLIAAILIMLEGHGGVIFRQTRVGAGMKHFVCYKFRTMRLDTPPYRATSELECPERYITKVGAVLRRLSIDELPQLINVIKGDMSLVGPRPVIPEERELIELRQKLGVYSVRPGITGLAQLRGRDCITNRRKAAYDAMYVERISLGYDICILIGTLFCVAGCRGVKEGGIPEKKAGGEAAG